MIIVSAEFNRGAGLGNKLFPWARAKLFSSEIGCPMVRTRWFSPHGGGITRGGIDYFKALRKIWLMGNFRKLKGEMPRSSREVRVRPLIKVRYMDEARAVGNPNAHIQFSWCGNHNFLDLAGSQNFIRMKLYEESLSSQADWANKAVADLHQDYIALNVRCGNDFVKKSSGLSGFVQTEQEWFVKALRKVRSQYGYMKAVVVSDGGRRQLSRLLKESDTYLLGAPSAIADLLVLSHARVLLGSGNSTFSAWASFLGEMDTYSSPDTPFLHAGLSDGRYGKKIVGTI